MSRYIDADLIPYFKTFNPNKGEKTIADMAWRGDIDSLPTADVVEVVRCKDCKHGYVYPNNANVSCEHFGVSTHVYDYCSFAERREYEQIH